MFDVSFAYISVKIRGFSYFGPNFALFFRYDVTESIENASEIYFCSFGEVFDPKRFLDTKSLEFTTHLSNSALFADFDPVPPEGNYSHAGSEFFSELKKIEKTKGVPNF